MTSMSTIVTGPDTARCDDASSVRVQLVRGSLTVLPRDEPGVWIEVTEVVGQPLEIATDADKVSIGYPSIGWEGWVKRLASSEGSDLARLTIYVGAGVTVSAATVGAEVTANRTVGDLDVSTASAPVRTSGTTGAVKVRTASGAVDVGSHTGPASVATASGAVRVEGELPRLSVTTVSGDITVRHGGAAALMSTTTVSGATRVRLPADAHLELESRGVASSVVIDGRKRSSGFGVTKVDDGSGARVLLTATTVSGEVAVERSDPGRLSTSDVQDT